MTTNTLQLLDSILQVVQTPFWKQPAFWIGSILGVAGLIFLIKAFLEARQAKRAATEAGQTVKIQTTAIELTEISQKLDKLPQEIHFNEARDLLNEISRRLRRATSPFAKDSVFGETIAELREALDAAKVALNKVRPTDQVTTTEGAPHAVYFAVEGDFATINSIVADLLGLFEKKSINFGDSDANEK